MKALADRREVEQELANEIAILQIPHLFGRLIGFELLGPIHSEWILGWGHAENDTALQAHRNSYKTSCIAVSIVRDLILDPNLSILVTRKDFESASQLVSQVRSFFEDDRVLYFFDKFYGVSRLATDNWSKKSLTIAARTDQSSKEGSVEASGFPPKTGQHYDRIYADDIITEKDRYSKAERQRTIAGVHELHNIRKPGGLIHFTGTPWHKEDAWSVIPRPRRHPVGSIPIAEFTPEKIEEKRKKMPPSLFAINYLLEHEADENLLFSKPLFAPFPAPKDTLGPVTFALDQAYGGEDTTALVGVWTDQQTGRLHAIGKVWERSVTEVYTEIAMYCVNNSRKKKGVPDCVLYAEKNGDKGLSAKALRGLCPFDVRDYNAVANKHARILGKVFPHYSIESAEANQVAPLYLDPDRFEALDQVCEYAEDVKPCDAIDALATAIEMHTKARPTSMGGREIF